MLTAFTIICWTISSAEEESKPLSATCKSDIRGCSLLTVYNGHGQLSKANNSQEENYDNRDSQQPVEHAANPPQCPPNMVCLTLKEAADLDRRLTTLESSLAVARLKRQRKLGWTLGGGFSCGPSFAAGIVTCIPAASITYGWRF